MINLPGFKCFVEKKRMINFEKRDNSMLSRPTKFMEANFKCSL